MKSTLRIGGLWWILGLCISGLAQTPQLQFQRYYAEQGLSTSLTRCLLEDQQGFLWVGSLDGLNRFDGYDFRVFKPNPRQAGSISSNNIYQLTQDARGRIWIATLRGGLNYYDPQTERFTVFRHDPADSSSLSSDEVIAVLVDQQQSVWVGTREGLDRLVETDSGSYFVHYDIRTPAGPSPDRRRSVYSLALDPAGYIWAGAGVGLTRINPYSGQITNYSRIPALSPQLESLTVNQSYFLDDTSAYLATAYGGLLYLSFPGGLEQDTVKVQVNRMLPDVPALSSISCLAVDRQQQLWVGTGDGLYRFPQLPHIAPLVDYQVYLPEEGNPQSISWKAISDLLLDRSGSLWVCTQDGINYLSAGQQAFQVWGADAEDPQQLSMGYVGGVTVLPNGDRWINTVQTVEHWDANRQAYTRYTSEDGTPQRLPWKSRVVKSLVGQDGTVWVATYGGLCRWEAEGRFTCFNPPPEPLRQFFGLERMTDIIEGREGELWLSIYHGLLRFDPGEERFTFFRFREPNVFTQAAQEADGNILVGSQLGLFRLNPRDSSFTHLPLPDSSHDQLKGEVIKSLLIARDQSLWIGGREALYHWQAGTQTLTQYLESDGLANAVVNTLLEDGQGRIWLSHNKGISLVDAASGEIRNFDETDGLGGNAFRSRAGFVGTDGTLYFGANHGVSFFHPDSIHTNAYAPPVVLTDFQLFNRSVPIARTATPATDTFRLEASITQLKQLRLSYADRVFSIGFSALSFYQAHKNQFAYRLRGYDQDWQFVQSGRRYATYTNLDPGTYTFEVKASNNDGVWSTETRSLRLVIDPPWWKTIWAYLIYAMLLGGAIYLLIRYRTQQVRQELQTQARIEQAKVEEREQVRARSSRDFHDEVGNKITKISLYTGLLKQQFPDQAKAQEMLTGIEGNVRDLGRGMRDFIWVLDPKQDNLRDTAERIRDFGQQLFLDTGVRFVYQQEIMDYESQPLELNLRRHLLMICKEALHNALKYAEAREIHLKIRRTEDALEVRIRDDGMGFSMDQLSRKGYGLTNMQSRAAECGATLTVEGAPGMGTMIHFRKALN